MRFSIVALLGLAAFGSNFGADARAISNDLSLSSSSLPSRDVEASAIHNPKQDFAVPVLPDPVESELVNAGSLERRVKIPSLDAFKAAMTVIRSSSLFYSGPGGYLSKAQTWSANHNYQYKTLWEHFKDPNYMAQFVGETEADHRASQALAELSSGTVYVMLPKGTKPLDWYPGTVWDQYEYKNLRLGSAVTKLVMVNPEDDEEVVIYPKP